MPISRANRFPSFAGYLDYHLECLFQLLRKQPQRLPRQSTEKEIVTWAKHQLRRPLAHFARTA